MRGTNEMMTSKLNDIEDGSFFVDSQLNFLCKGGSAKGFGEQEMHLCHPVTQGRFGPIVQTKIEVWLVTSEPVALIEVER